MAHYFIRCAAWSFLGLAFMTGVSRAEVVRLNFPAASSAHLDGKSLTIEVLSDQIIHFDISPKATSPILTTPMVVKKDFTGPTSLTNIQGGFQTPATRVLVDPNTLCVQYYDLKQNALLTTICPSSGDGLTLTQEQMQNVYGLGEQFRNLGTVNGDWIGQTRTPGGPYGNTMVGFGGGGVGNATFPIMYAIGKDHLNYALFLDDPYALNWDFTTSNWAITHPETPGISGLKPFRGYVMLGADLPTLRTEYMDLVGHPLVPPKKAFGLWVSEFGYRNWGEIDDHFKTLRQNKFPVDGFVLDLYWYGGYTSNSGDSDMGVYDWDKTNFPNAKQKIADYDQNSGLGLMLIEESYISQNKPDFSLMAGRGFLAKKASLTGSPALMTGCWWGNGGMVDWTQDQAGSYWHDLMRKPLTDAGVTFHWTDLGEPESYNGDNAYAGIPGYGNTEADIQNMYAFKWIQSISDGYDRNHETKRHFIMSRTGTSGIERFGSAMWSGDIGSNLRSLSSHLNAQMHMSMSGMDYYGADVGGFHREALEGDLQELYTRWLAHASFFDVPVRPHTDDGSKQNFTAPDRIGDMKSNLFNLRQRYELAPYYYSIAHQAYETGQPLVPPLVYYFQEDPNVRIIAEEKMIGPSLLVATSATAGETNRGVYLPAGDWIDYHTYAWHHSTGQWFADFPLYVNGIFQLPALARAGAIIPKAFVDDDTMNILGKRAHGDKNQDLILEVFASNQTSSFTVVEDDGITEAYRTGALSKTLVTQTQDDQSASVSIDPSQGSYSGSPSSRITQLQWIGVRAVSGVTFNGRSIKKYNDAKKYQRATEGWLDGGTQGVFVKTPFVSVSAAKKFTLSF
jgi:alpha-glucosidase (family GH31 glycosyl hydrolase)